MEMKGEEGDNKTILYLKTQVSGVSRDSEWGERAERGSCSPSLNVQSFKPKVSQSQP